MDVVVFDLWGRFGHFKKPYTTASPLTYSIPTPTALYGLLGAILGYEKDEYLHHINAKTTSFAIALKAPVKKMRLSFNYIDTKNSKSFHLIRNRTQIKTEILVNPSFRIYVASTLNEELRVRLLKKESIYTPSLGVANFLANFAYVGSFQAKPIQTKKIQSAILVKDVISLYITPKARYFKEAMALDMSPQREPKNYQEILFEAQGGALEGEFRTSYQVGEDIVSFLTPQ